MKCLFIFFIFFIASIYLFFKYPYMEETIGTKGEWADLSSAVDMFTKSKESGRVENKVYFSRNILIVNGKERVVILLNAESPPFYKQLPIDKGYYLTKYEYKMIKSQSPLITPTVDFVLRSRVRAAQ